MTTPLSFEVVPIEKPVGLEVIIGQGTFNLLTIEELFRAVAAGAPSARFGIAFCEASDGRLIRKTGNDDQLTDLAVKNAFNIACGHSFIILIVGAFPLQVLANIKSIPTVINIIGATGNACQAVVVRISDTVSALLGIADGLSPLRVENDSDRILRRQTVRRLGYFENG